MPDYRELPSYKETIQTLEEWKNVFPYGTAEHLSFFMTKCFFEQQMRKIVHEAIDEYKKWVNEENRKNPFEE